MNNSHCGTPLIHGLHDPGFTPPSSACLTTDDLNRPDTHYLLTPQGIVAKLELTRAFLRRKEEEHRMVKEEIRRLKKGLSETAGKIAR